MQRLSPKSGVFLVVCVADWQCSWNRTLGNEYVVRSWRAQGSRSRRTLATIRSGFSSV